MGHWRTQSTVGRTRRRRRSIWYIRGRTSTSCTAWPPVILTSTPALCSLSASSVSTSCTGLSTCTSAMWWPTTSYCSRRTSKACCARVSHFSIKIRFFCSHRSQRFGTQYQDASFVYIHINKMQIQRYIHWRSWLQVDTGCRFWLLIISKNNIIFINKSKSVF